MSDALWIAIITGLFGLLGKGLDYYLSHSKTDDTPRKKRRGDVINPATPGGILNPATIGLLVVGIVVGLLVVRIPGLTHPEKPTPTPTAVVTTAPIDTPTPSPEPAAVLAVGSKATVHTTAGDKLRLHSAPDFSASVTTTLNNGTAVTVIAGPQVVGTDRWWQVKTSNNKTGWAVESVEGIQTLVPSP